MNEQQATFNPTFVGFESFEDRYSSCTFIRHDLIKKGPDNYQLKLLVPGFDRMELSVAMFGSVLIVEGLTRRSLGPNDKAVYQGMQLLSSFKRPFVVREGLTVLSTDYRGGVLYIELGRLILQNTEVKPESVDSKQTKL